ncbi:MAG TPA: hypothetical protein GX014_03250 [Firmicutes bacterium]|nr:hypothetical protein [Bacillota bacterium]HHT42396.1 hypothetical protein [Bacillota bacterium]
MDKAHLYVVLTRTNTVISRLIHLVTRDEYTHAALALDRDLKEMYSFARKYTHNPFIGRFKHERLDEGIYRLAKRLPGLILEIEVAEEQYQQVSRLIQEFVDNSSRYKYNCRGLVYGLLNKPTKRDDRFLCSQFVYYLLKESGVVDFHMPANLVKPQHFLDLQARVVYQGDLKELLGTAGQGGRFRIRRWVKKTG